jgi:hypothetical protein
LSVLKDECDESLYDQVQDFQGEFIEPEARPTMFPKFLHVQYEIFDRATPIQL